MWRGKELRVTANTDMTMAVQDADTFTGPSTDTAHTRRLTRMRLTRKGL